MAYNYNIDEGKYPGEPGYEEWTGFEDQFKIPGDTPKIYKPIHPQVFHQKLLNKRVLSLEPKTKYTDFQIRCNAELEKNKRYFQPKGWSVEKLLYNYDLLFQSTNQSNKLSNELIEALEEHIKYLYEYYKVNIKQRIFGGAHGR